MNVPKILLILLVLGSVGLGALATPKLPLLMATSEEAPFGAGPFVALTASVHERLTSLAHCVRHEPLCRQFGAFGAFGLPPKSPEESLHDLIRRSLLDTRIGKTRNPESASQWGHLGEWPMYLEVDLALSIENNREAQSTAAWSDHVVTQGETLGALWNRHWGLPLGTLYQLGTDPESARLLDRLHPGQQIAWQIDPDGELGRLRLWVDRSHGYEWVRLDGTGQYTRIDISAEREIGHRILVGEVRDSLSAVLVGRTSLPTASARSIGRLLDEYRAQSDRARDGDSFTLLVEVETLVGDEQPHAVQLLAFAFASATHAVSAVRHSDGHFYSPEGYPQLPHFDRRPFHGDYRLTSGFDQGRRHPVTGRVAPHFGTDFSMPPGTPIVAPADGVVTHVDSHPLAGNFVEIEHGQGFATRYLHLQQALVRTGQQVKRGQRIALSGDTGRTTSAHLHYEVHVDGRPVDPMRVELPRGEPLRGAELAEFRRAALPLLAELREVIASRQLAMLPASGSGR